ncbi:HypC/HybG/HupF family hydrogenase formation chaperone [Pseudalkalibacillus sp. R45]|uniref:HypC/HybG/HupF family hydrogenase formation chaperone n=1 Tax=Pseudalkalibacillus sp. R45 TaxID=3457433 RepID=UPI003FCDF2F5
MCLSIPAKVISINQSKWQATVDYLGSQMVIGTSLLEKVEVGEYILVHAGEAIQVIDQMKAEDALQLWREMIDG